MGDTDKETLLWQTVIENPLVRKNVVSKSNELTFLRTVDLECCIWWVEYHCWLSYFAIVFVTAHFQYYYTAIFLFSYSIVSRPVTLACGHSGCKNCMETWAESTATPLCPQCRATFRKEELRLNVAMDKATRDLPVKCNSQGCQWKGNYSDANDHLRHCPKVRERCPNEGCQHVAAREEMTAHACPKERIACSGCQLSVTRERLQFHRTSLCRNSAVLCPLRCGASLPRYVVLIRIIQHYDILVRWLL